MSKDQKPADAKAPEAKAVDYSQPVAVEFSKHFKFSRTGVKTEAAKKGETVTFDPTDPAHPNAAANAKVALENGFGVQVDVPDDYENPEQVRNRLAKERAAKKANRK